MEENRYFDFLCSVVGRSQEYSILLDELHRIEYYALIPNDDNRGRDGEQLRQLFLDDNGHGGRGYLPRGAATVFEMLIGLSYRLEFESMESRWEKSPGEWFWVLIDNLGLTDCTDEMIISGSRTRTDVQDTVKRMLAREYGPDGNGSLFPMKKPQKDLRRVEIWYQMSAWIMENYPW